MKKFLLVVQCIWVPQAMAQTTFQDVEDSVLADVSAWAVAVLGVGLLLYAFRLVKKLIG